MRPGRRSSHLVSQPALIVLLTVACGSAGEPVRATTAPVATAPGAIADATGRPPAISAEPQRPGDAARGWEALTTKGYVGCGAPRALYDRFGGTTPAWLKLPGRAGDSADLPYFANGYTSASGVRLVTANCLGCHASFLRGELVMGLGDASGDFTFDATAALGVAGLLVRDPAEKAEWSKLSERIAVIAPHIRTRTVGANPADHIAAVLFAHRDPATLAWSEDALIELPDEEPVPVDVPAWWLMKKKTAMFHTGAGRGDHSRIMMTASVMCVDDVATAREVDAYFPDVRAFILSLEPPRYPGTIDAALAARGGEVFEGTCSGCHGTYGPKGRYVTRVIPKDVVGTDPLLADHAGQFAAPFTRWFNRSFYGEIARLEPGDGYVPPPLDGVWATAPYFHNGSVETLAAVLDSAQRPARWVRTRGGGDYDLEAVGWRSYTEVESPGADGKWIYDASRPGYSNAGHTFGDGLEPEERRAVIEYLKTL